MILSRNSYHYIIVALSPNTRSPKWFMRGRCIYQLIIPSYLVGCDKSRTANMLAWQSSKTCNPCQLTDLTANSYTRHILVKCTFSNFLEDNSSLWKKNSSSIGLFTIIYVDSSDYMYKALTRQEKGCFVIWSKNGRFPETFFGNPEKESFPLIHPHRRSPMNFIALTTFWHK